MARYFEVKLCLVALYGEVAARYVCARARVYAHVSARACVRVGGSARGSVPRFAVRCRFARGAKCDMSYFRNSMMEKWAELISSRHIAT